MIFRFAILLLSILHTVVSVAQISEPQKRHSYQDQALSLKLYTHQEWLNLLYYKPKLMGKGFENEVDDPSFFLSEKGETDPKAELLANIDAFFNKSNKQHPPIYCRFIARYHWLAKHLSGSEFSNRLSAINEQCSEYKAWRKKFNIKSAVLVFPAAYLNGPSSMFGHTLFRLDPPASESQSKLLSYALNYAAKTAEQDGEILYAYKGIFGGYPGFFSIPPYHIKVKEYGRIENRDVWEYSLNLTESEINRLMEHIWEIKQINFDYFFFSENCSYRLLGLLEVARPGIQITEQFRWRAIPADTVKTVIDAGLVKSIGYRASAATKLKHLAAQLSDEEIEITHGIISNPETLKSPSFQQLNEQRKVLVIAVAYRIVRYQALKITERNPHLTKTAYELLKLRSQLSAELDMEIKPPTRPEFAHDTRTLTIGAGQEDQQAALSFAYRPAYHQLLDNSESYLKGSAINFFESRGQQIESEQFRLTAFKVLEIKSFSPRSEFLKPKSWEIELGTERITSANSDRLRWYIDGGIGQTYSLSHSHLLYSIATVRAERHREFDHTVGIAAGFKIGLISYLNLGPFNNSSILLNFDYDNFIENSSSRIKMESGINFPLSRNSSVRVKGEYNKQRGDNRRTEGSIWSTEVGIVLHF